jgi:hypothetical protein
VCARIIINIRLVGVYVKEANELKGKERKGNIFFGQNPKMPSNSIIINPP